jgi:hypothetical protein
MSSPFTKGHSTVSKLKNRFSRASSPCSTTPTIKGILKKQTHHPYQQRPTSAIFNKQRPNRFSIQGVPSPNKKRYTVLSTMIMSTNDDNNNNNESLNRRRVRFNKFRDIHETYHKSDYDRTSDMDAVCTRLTAVIATQIKQELNHYKLHEMQVHDSSRIHTHFFL